MQEHSEWTDAAGQVYRKGDYVAVATVSSRSPQLVIGRVERINKYNSHGGEILKQTSITVECAPGDPDARSYLDGRSYKVVHETKPSCTVTVMPVKNARGFYRSVDRAVTYRIPENIVKIGVRLPIEESS